MKIIYYNSVLLLVCLLSACNGKFDYPPTVTRLLTGGDAKEWQLIKRFSRVGNNAPIEITTACNSDDTFTFYRNGSLVVSDNLIRCSLFLSQTEPMRTWLPDPQDQSIIYIRVASSDAPPFKTIITKLNEQELEFEIIESIPSSTPTSVINQSSSIYQFKAKGLFL